jgi:YesN/AraC family two-component response regulator
MENCCHDEVVYYTKGLNLLLVEDDSVSRDLYGTIFKNYFNKIQTAGNGQEALESWERNKEDIDIIITDLTMPMMSGIDLARIIKEKKPDQKIIALSAHRDLEKIVELISIHVDGFIPKPIELNQIESVIKKVAKECLEEGDAIEYRSHLEKMVLKRDDEF